MMRLQGLLSVLVLTAALPCAAQVHGGLRRDDREHRAMVDEVMSARSVNATPETRESLRHFYNKTASGVPKLSRVDLQHMLGNWSMPDARAIQATREIQLNRLDEIAKGQQAPVVKHYRGKRGVSFPAKQAVDAREFLESPSYKAAVELQKRAMSKDNMLAKFPAPKLPKCEGGTTVQMALQDGETIEAKSHSVDLLYLDWEAPLDKAEIFGERTFVHEFSTRADDYISALAGTVGVYCLPFRIRQTAQGVFWDVGVNALKNYDADGAGEGTLHPYIKAKFNLP